MRLLRYVLPILVVAAAPVHAQSDSEWYLNKPIEAIEFEGLDTVAENELSGVTDPFVGRDFTEPTFLELQRRLYALDYFEQIIPNAVRPPDGDEDRVIIRFEVQERPVISSIEFNGNDRLGRNRLLDVVVLSRGDMVTRSKLRVDEEAIRSLYLEQGFPDVEVSSEFIEDDDGENIVRFSVNEGDQISIETIEFVGNRFAGDSTLRGVIQLRERNIFNKGLFQASTLETDRNRIRRYYNEQGYVDAEVVEVEQSLREDEEDDRTFMTLTFLIEEGERYTFGGVDLTGNTIFTDEELLELVRLEEGEVLDLNRFDQDYQRIADRYYENGYIFNQITREQVRDEENNVVSFQIDIVERNRAHIENIVIRGNEKTRDYVIEREIPLEVGDVFSASKIREGLRNLANLQFFSSVAPETPQGSVEGLMDLVINLEEANTAEIVFGVAFGGNQDFPVSAQIQWQDRNFLGRGQTFGVQATASPINQQVSFNFLERWLLGRRWSGGLNLSFERAVVNNIPQDVIPPVYGDDDDNAVPDPYSQADYNGSTASIPSEYLMSYDEYSISLGANTGYTFRTPVGRFVPRTSVGTSINLITYDDSLYRPFRQTTRENLDAWRFRNRWSLGAALDNRDFVYSPSSGYRLDQGITFVGGALGGERHYVRTESTAETFFTLWDIPLGDWSWKGVLGLHSKLSFIWPNFYLSEGNDRYFATSDSDLLRIDGMFNSRGWPFQSNGTTLWNNWMELRMPISEQVIWWDTFFEAATLRTFGDSSQWSDRERLTDLQLADWQFSMGTGIRFVIPQFPIRLYLAKRFEYDESGNIEWQTGNLFNGGDVNSGRGLDLVFTIGAEFF
ncbi:MAG TPA: outer membrane protein assembly factor BamA [Alkalispirochaeta sp.]|nr:outer membrane protein assembly factor BamA [Alkalispirochaeta sp.]